MIIDIAAQGGFGGITATRLHKHIAVAGQPAAMRQQLCSAFDRAALDRLARQPCRPCADRISYRITVTPDDGAPHSVTLREDQIPPEMLDLIDRF